jgi:hypothetical protein
MMKRTSIEKRIQATQEAQAKLAAQMTQLKREQAAAKKAEREKLERAIGRLALKCGLGRYRLENLEPAFRTLALSLDSDRDEVTSDPAKNDAQLDLKVGVKTT